MIEQMESQTTSKTSCLKALLVRAWRERWSDVQWGINIKTVLPRGVSGDVYDLADCILQQAVIGSGANCLVLSYLKHSLSAQLVSHAAVLQQLAKFQQLHKIYCVQSLLEFLEGILPGVTCCGKSEGTRLASALQATTLWLLQVLQSCYSHQHIYDKANGILKSFLSNDFYLAMMCLAKYVEPDMYQEIEKKCREFSESNDNIRILLKMDPDVLNISPKNDQGCSSLIQSWLAIQMVINPGCSTVQLMQKLRLLQRLKNYSESQLFAEIMRGSLMALHDVRQTQYESQWGAFCFLKVPSLLTALANKSDSSSICSAIETLLEPSPLLDAMDIQQACSNLDWILSELVKQKLLAETQKKNLMDKTQTPVNLKLDMDNSSAGIPKVIIPKVIICAETSLAGILKTLSTDYQKFQDDLLLGMLQQILTGKSFELVLAVATVQGQLKALVQRLVRLNECLKVGGDKARSQLFDISFIMLVAIVQRHGTSLVLDGGDSFFEKWVANCMVEPNRPKASEQLLKLCDPVIVDALLKQFNSGEADFTLSNIKWQDVLFNMSGVTGEVLIAWEQGALAPADVKRILDAIRGRMCCIPLAAAAWLCAYMRTAPHDTLLKPFNMVHELLLSSPNAEDDSLRERWQLTCEIIRKMQRDVQNIKPKGGRSFISTQPISEQLSAAWKLTVNKGWLEFNAAKTLHYLLETAGPRWLVTSVLQELLKIRPGDLLTKSSDIALAVFHVDIKACTTELLLNCLPQLLHNSLQAENLVESQLEMLARLTSNCVYAASNGAPAEESADEMPAKRQKLDVGRDTILDALKQLLVTLETGMQEGQLPQQTYFTFQLLKSIVEVKMSMSESVLSAIPPTLGSQLLRTLPDSFTPGILLNLHDLHTSQGRSHASRDLCVLRNYQLRNVTIN